MIPFRKQKAPKPPLWWPTAGGCVGRHVVGARHGRRGPGWKDASRSVRPEPLSARHSQPWGQAANQPSSPPRRPRARTGTWTTRQPRARRWTDGLTGRHLPFRSARHGTSCPPRRPPAPHLASSSPGIVSPPPTASSALGVCVRARDVQ